MSINVEVKIQKIINILVLIIKDASRVKMLKGFKDKRLK